MRDHNASEKDYKQDLYDRAGIAAISESFILVDYSVHKSNLANSMILALIYLWLLLRFWFYNHTDLASLLANVLLMCGTAVYYKYSHRLWHDSIALDTRSGKMVHQRSWYRESKTHALETIDILRFENPRRGSIAIEYHIVRLNDPAQKRLATLIPEYLELNNSEKEFIAENIGRFLKSHRRNKELKTGM